MSDPSCKYIQYMLNKPTKYGLKLWIVAKTWKQIFVRLFSYLEKDNLRSNNVSVFTIETKINYTSIKKRYNATCDNYFTSIELSLRFEKKNCSVVRTIHQNRKVIWTRKKKKKVKPVIKTLVIKFTKKTILKLTLYRCKKQKSVVYFEKITLKYIDSF